MGGSVESAEGDVGFQIAPMVDVVFVIMLFFMANAGVQISETELGLSLPGDSRGAAGISVPQVITIQPDGNVVLESRIFDTPSNKNLPQLRERLRDLVARFPDTPVIIKPDPGVRHERVIDVLNAAAAAKVKNLTFG